MKWEMKKEKDWTNSLYWLISRVQRPKKKKTNKLKHKDRRRFTYSPTNKWTFWQNKRNTQLLINFLKMNFCTQSDSLFLQTTNFYTKWHTVVRSVNNKVILLFYFSRWLFLPNSSEEMVNNISIKKIQN